MSLSVRFLLWLNGMFPKIEHPLSSGDRDRLSYPRWQFSQGARTLECFLPEFSPEDILRGKDVLDLGCGAAGKSLYYLSLGANSVVGVDMVEHYKEDAYALADELGLREGFRFVLGDATDTKLPSESFDVVIMNDFMEHVSRPERALSEAMRLLRPNGRIYVTLPPYYHPTGAHLSDAVYVPWVHLLFSEKTLIKAYKQLIADEPDAQQRIALRFGTDEKGKESITYINKMTLKRFYAILKRLEIKPVFLKEIPLRKKAAFLAKIPVVKEMFVKMCAVVIEK